MQSSNLGLLAKLEGSSFVWGSPNVPLAPTGVFGMSLRCTWVEGRWGIGEERGACPSELMDVALGG